MKYAAAISGFVACVLSVAVVSASAGGAVFFSGYGEMHYTVPSNGTSELDFHRLVLGFGTNLSDDIGFHAELDFEHAFSEPEVEFAHLDYFFRDEVSFRAGLVLMPVGPINEFHEPPLFYSVERPYTQKLVIPTTWQEPGAGIYGSFGEGSVHYRAYIVGGLDAAGFRASDGIRNGRQKGAEAKAEDLAVVGRIDYSPTLSVKLGASGYRGGADQGEESLGDASVSIAEFDAEVTVGAVEVSGMYATVFIGDAEDVSTSNATVVGERITGINGEVALHVLKAFGAASETDLVVFLRGEIIDTNDDVPFGFERDSSLDRDVVTFGLSFLPVSNVAIKSDFEFWEAGDGSSWEQINFGVGFMY